MRTESLGVTIDETSSDLREEPTPDNLANRRGMEVQRDLCGLLEALDYVLWVRQTRKDGSEDKQKIDLVVGLDQSKKDLVIPEVSVQVKASTTGVVTFKRHIMIILKRDKPEGITSREEWMLKHRIILLVGSMYISRSRKSRRPITSEEIVNSFETQLERIDCYERSKLPQE